MFQHVWLVFMPRPSLCVSGDVVEPATVIRVFRENPTKEVLEKQWFDMLGAFELQSEPKATFEHVRALHGTGSEFMEYVHPDYSYLYLQVERHDLR